MVEKLKVRSKKEEERVQQRKNRFQRWRFGNPLNFQFFAASNALDLLFQFPLMRDLIFFFLGAFPAVRGYASASVLRTRPLPSGAQEAKLNDLSNLISFKFRALALNTNH